MWTVIPAQTLLSPASPPAAAENLASIPFHVAAFHRVATPTSSSGLEPDWRLTAAEWNLALPSQCRCLLRRKEGEAVKLEDCESRSVSHKEKNVLVCSECSLDAADSQSQQVNRMTIITWDTFQNNNNSRATHVEFYDVIYQVAGDRMPVHLVDDHLLREGRGKETESCKT